MHWTWDPDKDRINQQQHRIDFQTAQLVFHDPFAVTEEDPYPHEQRWKTTGTVRQTIIVVIHTWPDARDEDGRIISARKATPFERRDYEEQYAKTD